MRDLFSFTSQSPAKCLFFFFNDPATPEIYPLPLPDPFPISRGHRREASAKREANGVWAWTGAAHHKLVGSTARQPPLEMCFRAVSIRGGRLAQAHGIEQDRKSTRLNSSHLVISYAVFCLNKK